MRDMEVSSSEAIGIVYVYAMGSLQSAAVLDRIIGKFSKMSEAMFSSGLVAVWI